MAELLKLPVEPRAIPAAVLLFFGIFLLTNRLHIFLCTRVSEIACIRWWPISLVFPRMPPEIGYPNWFHLAVGAASILLLALALAVLGRAGFHPILVTSFGLALILATTLTHGWQFGLTRAAAGFGNMPQDYYVDARQITNPQIFIRSFTDRQPDLQIHSRTHPPGAVLAFFLLQRLVGDPAILAITVAALASVLTGVFLTMLLSAEHDRPAAGRTLFLYFLVPSVQIYYAASLDGLIAPLVLGSCAILFSNSRRWWIASILSLILASFLSFGVLFVLPVAVAFEIGQRRRVWPPLCLRHLSSFSIPFSMLPSVSTTFGPSRLRRS